LSLSKTPPRRSDSVSNIANFSSREQLRPHHAKNAGGRNLVGQRCEGSCLSQPILRL